MPTNPSDVRIGIYGNDSPNTTATICRHPGLWALGYAGSVSACEAVPIDLFAPTGDHTWGDILEEIDGVVLAGFTDPADRHPAHEEALVKYCRERSLPLLAIDQGMHILNNAFGGTVQEDLARDRPEALQHRQPPEDDIRHAINVYPDTLLACTYGEGEVIVNSEHRGGIDRVGRGFKVSGEALDGVVEAIEWINEGWFALGIQWQPASATSSGLDIQVFRTLIDMACNKTLAKPKPSPKLRRRLAKAAAASAAA
ncbi:MAG: gamma-glutamyl-gamma-aminobutyrate hydrolase family protein [Gemmataceae bacterium]